MKQKIEKYIQNFGAKKLGFDLVNKISVKEIDRGGYNLNYLVKINNNKFIFRFNLDKYLLITKNQIEYEYETLSCLEGKNLSPEVYFFDISKKHFKNDFLVEEFIDNQPLQFNPKFLGNMGKIIKRLHTIIIPKNKKLIRNEKPLINHLQYIRVILSKIKKSDKPYLKMLKPYLKKAEKFVLKNARFFKSKNICLNHRDLAVENVLQTKNGLKLIDWQTAMLDDPSYDLSFFTCDFIGEWNMGRPFTNKEKQIFLESYQTDNKMLDKIFIRQPILYLEMFIWFAYRANYLKNELKKGLVVENDKNLVTKRIANYESFLREKRIKEYLSII